MALNKMLVRQPRLSARTEKRFRVRIVPTGIEVVYIPMAIPMLAGPGAISTVMLYVSEGNIVDLIIVIFSVFATMIITYVLLRNADKIFNRIGRVGSLAISRIMGLILAAVAVQFLINGIHDIALGWITEFSALTINVIITSFFF